MILRDSIWVSQSQQQHWPQSPHPKQLQVYMERSDTAVADSLYEWEWEIHIGSVQCNCMGPAKKIPESWDLSESIFPSMDGLLL